MISITLPKKFVAIDTEATGLSPWFGGKMFATSAVFPSGRILFWRDSFSGLKSLLKDCNIDKVFQNANFDIRMLEWAGFKVRGNVWDTMILAHLLDAKQSLALEQLTVRYLPPSRWKVVKEINEWFDAQGIPKKERGDRFIELPKPLLRKRCENDALLTCLLFAKLYPVVAETFPRLLEQEHRLLPTVKRMEDVGIPIDNREVAKQERYLTKVVADVEDWCRAYVGSEDFSIGKRKDKEYLLKKSNLLDAITVKTDKGQLSFSQESLSMLHHPAAQMLALGVQAKQLCSTFLGQVKTYQVNNIIHPNWHQLGTVTGRFSSTKPNVMNIPTEGGHLSSEEAEEHIELTGIALAPHIERIFTCLPGYCLIYSDKKKIEVCMLAHYTKDPVMLNTIRRGDDIHKEMSIRMFGEATKGLRVRAKVTVFGWQYGAGDAALANNCKCSIEEVRRYRMRLNQTCPRLNAWKNHQIEKLFELGYVQTDHGRRHYLSPNYQSYMVVNRMCQGTAADEVKSRMVAIGEWLNRDYPDASIVVNIHDALGTAIPLELLPKILPQYHKIMEQTSIPFMLPLAASKEFTSTRWSDLKNVKSLKLPYLKQLVKKNKRRCK